MLHCGRKLRLNNKRFAAASPHYRDVASHNFLKVFLRSFAPSSPSTQRTAFLHTKNAKAQRLHPAHIPVNSSQAQLAASLPCNTACSNWNKLR